MNIYDKYIYIYYYIFMYPRWSMYGIFTYIYPTFIINL